MGTITTKDGVEIFYKDWGPEDAQPLVFHHGWPLSADDWDAQMLFFLAKGYRVIAHDRRGHGRSSHAGARRQPGLCGHRSVHHRRHDPRGVGHCGACRDLGSCARASSRALRN